MFRFEVLFQTSPGSELIYIYNDACSPKPSFHDRRRTEEATNPMDTLMSSVLN